MSLLTTASTSKKKRRTFINTIPNERKYVMNEFQNQLNELPNKVLSKALTEEEKTNYTESLFESIKHVNDYGEEFWYARELQKVLEYSEWRNFSKVIDKAIVSCNTSKNNALHHFVEVNKTIKMPKSATKEIEDIELSRYACYLIVMNGNPRKKVIAVGQTYFAVKTRQQELVDNYEQLTEEQLHLQIRNQMKIHNKSLANAAHNAGVIEHVDYAIFQNSGYQGLYGGLDRKDIHERKDLKKSQNILDHMGSTELAANLFRATQTDEKLHNENIIGKTAANKTHYEVGKKVRETIAELGGAMPETLPTPQKSIKQIEREQDNKQLEEI